MAVLPAKNDDPVGKNDALFASDFGSIVLYPNIECGAEHLVVLCTANGPDAAFQFWQRFGNWFNWGVFDNSKYFDYCVYDARSHSPETMLLIGWYGTDWSVENGVYYLGDDTLREEAAPQCYPPLEELPNNRNDLLLAELQPTRIDQMRGAVNFGRGYSGERLALTGSIGVRAPSVLEYDIGGRYKTFQAGVHLMNSPEHGIPDIRRYYETVTFELFGDGKLLCQRKLTWSETVGRMEVKIKGVKKLTLKLSCSGGPSWLHSEATWISPRLSVD